MDTVLNNGQMVPATRESTKKARRVDKEFSNGQMDPTFKESLLIMSSPVQGRYALMYAF